MGTGILNAPGSDVMKMIMGQMSNPARDPGNCEEESKTREKASDTQGEEQHNAERENY